MNLEQIDTRTTAGDGPVAQNYVQFCVANGYPTHHDVESHIHAGLRSAPTSKSYQRRFDRALRDLQIRRDQGVIAYRAAVASGSVVDIDPPSGSLDRLQRAAEGHPDNESTKAAIRLLAKRRADLAGEKG